MNYFAAPLAASVERRSHKYPRRHRSANHWEKRRQPHRSARVLFQLNRWRNVFHPVAAVKHGRVVIASCEDTGVPSSRHVRQFPSYEDNSNYRVYCRPRRRRRSLNRVIVSDRSTLATLPPASGRSCISTVILFIVRLRADTFIAHGLPRGPSRRRVGFAIAGRRSLDCAALTFDGGLLARNSFISLCCSASFPILYANSALTCCRGNRVIVYLYNWFAPRFVDDGISFGEQWRRWLVESSGN